MPGDKFLELATASDQQVLNALFRHAREGVTIQGPDGLIYANQQAASMVGVGSGEEMVAMPAQELWSRFEMIDEDGKPFPIDKLPGRLVLQGHEPSEVTVGYRSKGSPRVRWSRVASSPIKSDTGEVVWALNFFLDITAEFMQRERERILGQAIEALSGSLEMDPHLSALSSVVVPELASWCGFHLLNEFDELVLDAVAYPQTPDTETLFRMVEPGPISRDSDRLQAITLRTGKSQHLAEVTEEVLKQVEEERGTEVAEIVRRLEFGAVLCVPLGVADSIVGTMTLVRSKAEGPFSRVERSILDEIGFRAGAALSHAHTYEQEHQTAEALRRGLRPLTIPEIADLDIAAEYLPVSRHGHEGGDFYDVMRLDDQTTALLVGDVEGKGVEAAAAVGLIRQTLRATISLASDPHVVFRQLNEAVTTDETHSRMCTLAYVILEREGGRFSGEISLAGHPPAVILRADGTLEEVGVPCPPAAVYDEIVPIPKRFHLDAGDTLFLYTDGLANSGSTPPETVRQLLRGLEDLDVETMLGKVINTFIEQVGAQRDDTTALAVKVRG